MCDNCTCNERTQSYEALKVSVEQQRRIIDQLEADAGKKQVALGELQTENLALRTTIANTYARLQQMTDNAEAELERREESILCLMEAGAA